MSRFGEESNGNDDNQPSSIEQDILNDVASVTGDSFEDHEADETSEQEQDEEKEQRQSEEELADEEAPPKATQSRRNNPGKREPRQQEPKRIPARRRVDYDYDTRTGDVINPATGEVIYPMGSEQRDLFTALQNERFNVSKLEQRFAAGGEAYRSLEAEFNKLLEAPSVAKQLNLSVEDQVTALQHMAAFRANPVQGLRKMLTQFQLDGGDLSDIFDNVQTLQLDALKEGFDKRFEALSAPQREAEASKKQETEQLERLNREVQTFLTENPEAEQHTDLLAHVINTARQNGQQMTLSQAWTNVLRFANTHGIDVRRPLKEQLEARQQQGEDEAPRVSRQRPMPRGNNGTTLRRNNRPGYDCSNRDTVREAMEEAGFRFD